jgi:cysteinyl-tRNA synthetase
MALMLYNTAHRCKEVFQPLSPGEVGMYVCGVTVYDLCHIGHARSAIVFDVLARYLRARGYRLSYVRNFTDVDDKIIDRASELGMDPAEVADRYIQAFYEDMDRLGVERADHEPRATEYVGDMIEMIRALLEKGYAYRVDGDVFFSVDRFPGYGALSGRRIEDMKAGSRVAVDERKHHPMDFSLWKSAKPGEPAWESPWGPGRPGWHVECSVMSNRFLGETFDIHGGGRDLLFPHHENERAQAIAAKGGGFARYWVHNGFVTVESEKMSKSTGNFLTIRDALERYHPEVLRLFLLSKHYRSPLDFAHRTVEELHSGLARIYRTLERMEDLLGPADPLAETTQGALAEDPQPGFLGRFVEVMDDDLNTAGAIGLIFDKVKDLNRSMDSAGGAGMEKESLAEERRRLLLAGRILGVLQRSPASFFQETSGAGDRPDPEEVERLIKERSEARARKDWAKADGIRDFLRERGVVLEDGPEGTRWRFEAG